MKKSRLKYLLMMLVAIATSNYSSSQIQIGADIDGKVAGDQSGSSVSMPDAYTLAIGSPFNDNGVENNAGQVRVYRLIDSTWQQKGDDIEIEIANATFGNTVSMPDSNTIAIGAEGGRLVQVYDWNGNAWVQKGTNFSGANSFGHAVCMPDANTLAIGAPYEASAAGRVYVYMWNGTSWVQKGLNIDGEGVPFISGSSLSMPDSNTLAIGSPNNGDGGYNSGSVRVYSWNGTAWQQKGGDLDGENMDDKSASSISMPDSNTLAIGAPWHRGNGNYYGQVRVFTWDGNAWNKKGADLYGDTSFNYLGASVSMPDANTLAAGANENSENGAKSGKVYLYTWDGNAWVKKGTGISGEAAGDKSGTTIHMPDPYTLAIGAPFNQGNGVDAGQVRVFGFCRPTSSNISASACFNYTSPSTLYTWDSSGVYMDTVQNAGGCDSVITITLTINKVDVSVTNSSPMLSANASGAKYQWLDCSNNFAVLSNDTNQVYTATVNGNYAVEITQNGCVDTSACETVGNVSIQKNNFTSKLIVYPNPTSGNLSIDLGAEYKGIQVTLKNALGQEISTQNFASASLLPLQINGAKGIYFIEIKTANHTALIKVIKE